jgi:uncharacterized protein YutE (UPF0331/DUF86 family)
MVAEDVFVEKLRYIHRYTDDLDQMRGMSREEYLEDVVTQRAVERTLMNLVQACIDLARHVRSSEDLSPSGTAKQEIEALGNAGVISQETQTRLEEAVGFRNVLAHRYGDVDHEIVYEVLQNRLRGASRRPALVRAFPTRSRPVVPAGTRLILW